MYHLLHQSVIVHSVFIGLLRVSMQTAIISLNTVKKLIFVMVKCGVLFELRTESLNISPAFLNVFTMEDPLK
jgi:hypothetical protein